MNKAEKQKTKDLVENLRHALPPEYGGLALEVDKVYGELRRGQSARDVQRDAEYAARLAAERAEMQSQYDLRVKEMEATLAAEFNRRYEDSEARRAVALTMFAEEIAEKSRDLNAIKKCISGGLEMYMFCDDYGAGGLGRLEMAALMALADWVRSSDSVAVYLDGTTGYGFFICKACPTAPTVLVGMPQREIERLKTPLPTRKLPRTAKKFLERKVFQSIPGD